MKDPNASALGKKGGKKSTPAKARAARQNASKPPKPGRQARGRPFKESTRNTWLAVSRLVEYRQSQGYLTINDATTVCRTLTEAEVAVRKSPKSARQVARDTCDAILKLATERGIAVSIFNQQRLLVLIERSLRSNWKRG